MSENASNQAGDRMQGREKEMRIAMIAEPTARRGAALSLGSSIGWFPAAPGNVSRRGSSNIRALVDSPNEARWAGKRAG
jgi:hypothetical protein